MNRVDDTSTKLRVGVDVGGTKVAVLVAREGREIVRKTNPTRLDTPQDTLTSIAETVQEAVSLAQAKMTDVEAIGIGIPGRVDSENGIAHLAVNLNWRNMPVGVALEQKLGIPCFLENDVRMAALGLKYYPGYDHVKNLAYVSVGTGIAAGVILNRELYRGTLGMAGEIGHIEVIPGGPLCQCGARGCLEAVASGPAIEKMMRDAQTSITDSSLTTDLSLSAGQIFLNAANGDLAAKEVTRCVGKYLGWAMKLLALSYDVQLVVFGGGVARAGAAFLAPILEDLERQRQESELAREMLTPEKFQLLPPGFDAALWGGIALAENGLGKAHKVFVQP